MIWYTCFVCKHLDRLTGGRCGAFTGKVETLPLSIVAGQLYHTKPWPSQATDKVFELAPEFREIEIVLTNKDWFPTATLLDQKDYETIGFAGDDTLILVGWEFPDKTSPLVVRWDAPYVKGDYLAFRSDYKYLNEEGILELFQEDQEEMDAAADEVELRLISLHSLLNHAPGDVRLDTFHPGQNDE
jgi:hypothetical protein